MDHEDEMIEMDHEDEMDHEMMDHEMMGMNLTVRREDGPRG